MISSLNESPFITVWDIFPNKLSFTLPLKAGFNYDFIVDWGDGSPVSQVKSYEDSSKIHLYANAGIYSINIQGVCESFYNSPYLDDRSLNECLVEVVDLGNTHWKDLSSAFYSNKNLGKVSGGDTSLVTDMSHMFSNCSIATPNTSKWDTSNVTNMSYMFEQAQAAKPNTSNWDVSKVTDMSWMFSHAFEADPDTTNWDVSKVTTMVAMFESARMANPNTISWDTSSVQLMAHMFDGAVLANPDVSKWSVSQVKNMQHMFMNATSATPDRSNWDRENW